MLKDKDKGNKKNHKKGEGKKRNAIHLDQGQMSTREGRGYQLGKFWIWGRPGE